jgi:CRP-like cAMP-binding protein
MSWAWYCKALFRKSYGEVEIFYLRNDPSDLFYVVLHEWGKVCRETPDSEEAVFGVLTRAKTMAETVAFELLLMPAFKMLKDRMKSNQ